MKKIALVSAAALAAAIATPASAAVGDVTGTVNITGSVAAKCLVVTGAGTSSTFGTTVALGELAQADGTMKTDLATTFGTVGGAGLSAKVVCTTANPTISVDADPITSATAAGTGYDNSIDFQANVAVTTLSANASPYSNDSAAAAGSATALGSRLANTATNVTISASNFRTNNLSDLLVAATDYAGKITVVIAPGA